MSYGVEGKINYDGVGLEFLLEHPGGAMELGQLKNKASLLSVQLGLSCEEVYDGILLALKKMEERDNVDTLE